MIYKDYLRCIISPCSGQPKGRKDDHMFRSSVYPTEEVFEMCDSPVFPIHRDVSSSVYAKCALHCVSKLFPLIRLSW